MIDTSGDILITTHDTKDEAELAMHEMALTLQRLNSASLHGVYVRRIKGTWGVWLHPREEES